MRDGPDSKRGRLHDSMFKKSMEDTDFASDFLKIWLPDNVKAVCDFSTLKSEPGEFTDGHGKSLFCDKLFSVQTENGSRGWIIVEHQSGYDKNMIKRLEQYKRNVIVRECKKDERRPLVVPLLVYHGDKPWAGSQDIYSLYMYPEIERTLDNGFPLADLTALSYDKIMMHGRVAMLELVFKSGRNKGERSRFLEMFSSLKDRCDDKLYNRCLKYWIDLNVESRQELEKLLSETPKKTRGVIMLAVDGIFAEERLAGMQIGEQKGIETGKLETAQNLVRLGIPYEKIAAATGLKEEDLRKKLASRNIS